MRVLALSLLLALAAACDTSTCNTITSDVGSFCVPDTLAPNQETVIQVRELCGRGCSHQPSCSATYRDGVVTLNVEQDICDDAQFVSCLQLGCVQRVSSCRLPSLAPGDYTLLAPGSPAHLLHVRDGGQASCRYADADGGV